MNYENQPCPVCGKHLHEGDDVVVCPDCGTPEHRACWLEEGHCANAALHEQGYSWSVQSELPAERPAVNDKPSPAEEEYKICIICGSENPSDFEICANCGAPLQNAETKGYAESKAVCPYCGNEVEAGTFTCPNCGAPLIPVGPPVKNPYASMAGFDESERIGEFTIGDFALYVRRSVRKYIPLFKTIEEGRKITFNWGAFFFGPVWYFFRRIYSVGIVFILLTASASLFFTSATEKFYDIAQPYADAIANQTITDEELQEIYTEVYAETKKPMLIGFALLLAINIASAFAADQIYYKRAVKDIGTIKEAFPNADIQKMYISRRGGTSVLSAICGFFTFQIAANLLVYVAQYIGNIG